MLKKNSEQGKVFFGIMLAEISFLIVLIFLSLYLFRMQHLGQEKYNLAVQLRHKSYLLADQLRQSSDDLTRMVRSYVVTGNRMFESFFWDILAIRDGKKSRPINYERIYWDFMTVEKPNPPFKEGEKAPLKKLMREAEFTEDELQLIDEAQTRSDSLVWLERIAMHAMKGIFQDEKGEFSITGVPDPEKARQIVFGKEYHEAKKNIMEPINVFLGLIDRRTLRNVTRANEQVVFYQWALLFVFGVLVINGFLLLLTAKRYQGWMVNKLKKSIRQQAVEIAERDKAEEAVRDSEKKLYSLLQNIQAAVVVHGPATELITCNKAAQELLGLTEEQMLGKKSD
ncbi:MAG: PAS domain S-box protein [Candidatus Electrothrix sp. ATG2]|nr:PAS domain S-box protein [Candidatus Electrothrix sp. ATG2]